MVGWEEGIRVSLCLDQVHILGEEGKLISSGVLPELEKGEE